MVITRLDFPQDQCLSNCSLDVVCAKLFADVAEMRLNRVFRQIQYDRDDFRGFSRGTPLKYFGFSLPQDWSGFELKEPLKPTYDLKGFQTQSFNQRPCKRR